MSELQIAVLFILGIVTVEVVKLTVGRVFKKTVETEYQTALNCRLCREECQRTRTHGNIGMQGEMSDLGRSIDLLRGILLVIAVKVGVEDHTIEKLAYGRRESDK